jgi:hypothetical protein
VTKPQIISSSTCLKLFSTVVISDTQRKAQQKWLEKLESKELETETTNYRKLEDIILRDLLDFPEELIQNSKDKKNVEYAFKDPQGGWAVLFEAKGTKTTNLHANQGRKDPSQATPIDQTYDNLTRFPHMPYGVCTNYQKFILMERNLKFSALQEFDFLSTKNNDEKLKEFIGIFGYKSLVINKDITKFKSKSDNADLKLTNEFYKLFHETRLMLVKSFKEKQDVSDNDAFFYSQLFLQRILFLFFALDNGLIEDSKLFRNRIFGQLKLKQCTENSKKIFNDIMLIFEALDKGSKFLHIDGFGGELFSGKIPEKIYFLDFQSKSFFANEIMHSQLSQELKFHGDSKEIWKEFGDNVSPIIRNLLIMDSRDFKSEFNVTILGHILEQSLDDLTQLQKTGHMKRKIDGVYYTPPNLTDYICRNTIIPYLSQNNTNDIRELVDEYRDEIGLLEEKIQKIRIIDPACGSGAFLINAAEILLEITEQIEIIKNDETHPVISGTLEEWQKEKEVSKIIENNIFGVDVNRESVEITKLSLFLMMAKPGETLANLSKNILNRNSLVDDVDLDPKAMMWQEEFAEIMTSGGFDIVIGNPPWQEVQPNIDEFFAPLQKIKLLMLEKFPDNKKPFSLLSKKEKYVLINECKLDPEIKTSYEIYLKKYHDMKNYFIDSNNYKYQVSKIRGKTVAGIGVNLYKLFVEKSDFILNKNGCIGFILPSGIYSHAGSTSLRKLLFEKYAIQQFVGFHNSKPIFRDVHAQEKFCTIICKKMGPTKKFLASFYVTDDEKLKNFKDFAFEYDVNLVKTTSPDQLSLLECRDSLQLEIFSKLFDFPFLHSPEWELKSSREFNMSDDDNLFHKAEIGFPLFEGKMIEMFDGAFAPPVKWVDEKDGRDELIRKEEGRIRKKNSLGVDAQLHSDHYRFVWRKLTNPTNTRTLISTILPPNVFLSDSLYFVHPIIFDENKYRKQFSYFELFFLCGMCNSFVVDYILRNKIDSNLTILQFLDLPIPRFSNKNIYHQKIFENSAKLICTTGDYEKLRNEVNVFKFVTDPEQRLSLEAQINAFAAKIYNLTRKELEYILELFPSDKQKRLRELTLDEFSLL